MKITVTEVSNGCVAKWKCPPYQGVRVFQTRKEAAEWVHRVLLMNGKERFMNGPRADEFSEDLR
jgi:hypothetical protein